jgi:hypothetical protein
MLATAATPINCLVQLGLAAIQTDLNGKHVIHPFVGQGHKVV